MGRMVPCGTIFVLDFCEYDHSATVLDVLPMAHQPSETLRRLVGEAREVASALYLPVQRATRSHKCSTTRMRDGSHCLAVTMSRCDVVGSET